MEFPGTGNAAIGTHYSAGVMFLRLSQLGRHTGHRHRRLAVERLESRALLATLPAGFTEAAVATGLSSATAMEFAPNGDLWVVEQTGAVKRFRPTNTTADVVGDISTLGLSSSGERGLLGIAFDPQYSTTKQVYLYYTALGASTHNRISRFTVDDTDAADYFFVGASTALADSGSSGTPNQEILFDLDPLSGATNHNGGAIHFGPDDKLYAAVGDNADGSNSQSLGTVLGKMLRINSDGTIPADNPFVGVTSGNNRSIWALGLRNPFTFAFQPGSGRMFINDVGQFTWEEINDGLAGANYGWPGAEGNDGTHPISPGTYHGPLYAYAHGFAPLQGFAITGGAFYNPAVQQFPAQYAGRYFFADYVNGWINVFDAGSGTATPFATNAPGTVDLRVTSDGSLYYLARNANSVFRVTATPSWSGYANDPQHTGISAYTSQALEAIAWQTPVDQAPQFSGDDLLIHYGSPVVTAGNTVIVPVKTGAAGGFLVEGINAETGAIKWTQTTDYVLPPHNWTPSYSPTLTPANRLYFAGAGGTIYYRDSPDAGGSTAVGQLAFYGLANYNANKTAYDNFVFINTPITSDSAGNIYFGFEVTGANPANLQSGIARISADGVGTWTSAAAASGDATITKVVMNAAPALSNNGQKLYIAVSHGNFSAGYLVALNSATLERIGTSGQQVKLLDPNGNDAILPDDGSASPTVGPDGDVFFGVLENPLAYNHYRGWLLHFSGDLDQSKIPGAFGWDDTASVVPASMVPSYSGTSSYLLLTKYNNYVQGGGDGIHKLAILDPQATMTYTVSGRNVTVMKEVLTIAGVTPDPEFGGSAVREWCINTAAVDPQTGSILANSEDGQLYRWDLSTNTFTERIVLTPGLGEAYTPTIIGVDGSVYAINNATLFAVRQAATLVAHDLAVVTNEDTPAGVTLSVATATGSSVSFEIVGLPVHGTLSGTAPNVTYAPADNFNGSDSFSFRAREGNLISNIATVSITVGPVNDSPRFSSGPDQQATDESGTQRIDSWATAISTGPPDEAGQALHFLVTNDNHGVFANQPKIDSSGKLTFAPAPNTHGTAVVTVALQDDGSGFNTSQQQTFTITITKPHPFHNASGGTPTIPNLYASDVTGIDGRSKPDQRVFVVDAQIVISFLTIKGLDRHLPSSNNFRLAGFGGDVLSDSTIAPYVDVTGPGGVPDNFLSPRDVLEIINHLNIRHTGGEGERAAVTTDGVGTAPALALANDASLANLIALLANETAVERVRRRRSTP